MKKHGSFMLVTFLVIGGLVLTSCQTTGQSAGLGGILGAGAGAIIGAQSGHAVEGALIGAALGAVTGLVIGDIKHKQVAKREQVEQQMQQRGEPVPTTPVVAMDPITIAPGAVQAGKTVNVNGKYRAIGPGEAPVTGKLLFMRDNTTIKEKPLNFAQTGENEFSADITPAPDAPDGTYKVVVALERGASRDEQAGTFNVVSTPQ